MKWCNLKEVVCGDKTTENYHPTLLFPSALFCSLF